MTKFRINLLILLIVTSIVYFPANAQNKSADTTALKEGAWALQFGISSNFTLTSFQGATIAAKYQISDMSAIRAGITIGGSTSSGDGSSSGSIADSNYGAQSNNSSSKSTSVSIVVQYLRYLNPDKPVHFYIGFGPSVSYQYGYNSTDNPYISTTGGRGYWINYLNFSKSIQWAAGGACIAGVEWFASQWLSIHADYNYSIQYQWRSTSSSTNYSSTDYPGYISQHSDNSSTTKGWNLSSSAVSFGINVYL
ncbi:MAG: hypothetical protein P4L45_07700 [Ignavibacteriaceae bacterium]|nr:hypothetical protein [Ignavibacteriaceae bacterium]